MKINEAEQLAGITKKNIRFYEDQGLLHPGRNENGYRDYSEEDVRVLLRIRLLRQLSVPIEDIRRLQENQLTLAECLERQQIVLAHEERNLSVVRQVCAELAETSPQLSGLDVQAGLERIRQLEEGGIRFMNVPKQDTNEKKRGAMTGAGIMTLLMLGVMALFAWGQMTEPLPLPIIAFLMLIPAAVIAGVWMAAKQRFKEIEGGEEDEAAKY